MTTSNLLDPTPQPRISDGIDHPVTVRHKLDSSLDCLDFHVKQNQAAQRVAAAAAASAVL